MIVISKLTIYQPKQTAASKKFNKQKIIYTTSSRSFLFSRTMETIEIPLDISFDMSLHISSHIPLAIPLFIPPYVTLFS